MSFGTLNSDEGRYEIVFFCFFFLSHSRTVFSLRIPKGLIAGYVY